MVRAARLEPRPPWEFMKLFSKKKLFWIAVVILTFVFILIWPVGSWLECREKHFVAGSQVDAVYLVAGARDQLRRIDALVDFLGKYSDPRSVDIPILVLVGNDRLKMSCSSEEQDNLTRAEWAVKRIKNRIQNSEYRIQNAGEVSRAELPVHIVPGEFTGTDGEMEALAQYLAGHAEIRNLVLVTSPFHIRRTLVRFDSYLSCDIGVSDFPAKAKWTDRAPWIVLSELFKMVRDSLGFSRVPVLSRQSL